MKTIDLRSDTVTLPTPAMREAMARAEVGDDVFGEDPTVNRLEALTAEKIGKEAALFVPSGTMGNLASVLTHCCRGEEVILGHLSHLFLNEAGGISSLGGCHPHTIHNGPDGTLRLESIEKAIRADNVHFPRTGLICLENSHNRCDGAVLTPAYMDAVADLAQRRGIPLHLDGARIFNAAVALNVDVRELTRQADSLNVCLSKGLAAPVGSLICGTRDFVAEARRTRKRLGGGMRQAGILAAAGIVALEQMVDRLGEDHENARRLAAGIAAIPGLSADPSRVRTNILYMDLAREGVAEQGFLAEADRRGLRFNRTGPNRFRLVTHWGLTAEDMDAAVAVLREVMAAL